MLPRDVGRGPGRDARERLFLIEPGGHISGSGRRQARDEKPHIGKPLGRLEPDDVRIVDHSPPIQYQPAAPECTYQLTWDCHLGSSSIFVPSLACPILDCSSELAEDIGASLVRYMSRSLAR